MGRKKSATSELDVAQKQDTPLAKCLRKLITDTDALKEHLGCTVQAVNQYKLGTSRPSLENLCKIADFYNVSTDYLLGRTETLSSDVTIQAVRNFTGLSEDATTALSKLNPKSISMEVLNALLVQTDVDQWLFQMYRIAIASSVAHCLEKETEIERATMDNPKITTTAELALSRLTIPEIENAETQLRKRSYKLLSDTVLHLCSSDYIKEMGEAGAKSNISACKLSD